MGFWKETRQYMKWKGKMINWVSEKDEKQGNDGKGIDVCSLQNHQKDESNPAIPSIMSFCMGCNFLGWDPHGNFTEGPQCWYRRRTDGTPGRHYQWLSGSTCTRAYLYPQQWHEAWRNHSPGSALKSPNPPNCSSFQGKHILPHHLHLVHFIPFFNTEISYFSVWTFPSFNSPPLPTK